MPERNFLAFIMACGYVNDHFATDKGRHMDKVRGFTIKEYENSIDPYQD